MTLISLICVKATSDPKPWQSARNLRDHFGGHITIDKLRNAKDERDKIMECFKASFPRQGLEPSSAVRADGAVAVWCRLAGAKKTRPIGSSVCPRSCNNTLADSFPLLTLVSTSHLQSSPFHSAELAWLT